MKKIIGILSVFLVIGLIICIVLGYLLPIPSDVIVSVGVYKFCTGIGYFLEFLPAMVLTGFVVSCSVHFGHNSEGSLQRFSPAMGKRFQVVMLISIICTALLTLSNETFGLMVNKKKSEIQNRPKLIAEYVKVGNVLYDQGFYARAARYADAVLKLDSNSVDGTDLKNRTSIQLKMENMEAPRFDINTSEPIYEKNRDLKIQEDQISQAHKYLELAKDAYANEKWFDAHYYAEIGLNLSSSKDPNTDDLRTISTQAWNNISTMHKNAKTQSQLDFEEKYRGYVALVEKDDLKAYYIFNSLSQKSLELARDPDVSFYLKIAKDRVEQRYFFVDETLELESFESANDVYFSYKYNDGTEDIVYFKGATVIEATGNSVQYLRDFSITTVDENGKWIKTMRVPYAKLMPVAVRHIDEGIKQVLELNNDNEFIPYILLKSVGRDNPQQMYIPTYTFADGRVSNIPEYMLFPINFDDFLMLEACSDKPETMYLPDLFDITKKAETYGYSEAAYGQNLLNRLFYPFFILILLVGLASFGWTNRIGDSQYFKFSWIFSIPFYIVAQVLFYQLMCFFFHLANYVFIGMAGVFGAIGIGLVFYLIALIISGIYFLARKSF
ncbi:MAG: hypothetical protein MJ160_05495 [Treponema sp.]|nr:hypothetical protein [Treponema sp.]